jgi:hypothetical protein
LIHTSIDLVGTRSSCFPLMPAKYNGALAGILRPAWRSFTTDQQLQ